MNALREAYFGGSIKLKTHCNVVPSQTAAHKLTLKSAFFST
jgi:hypothetical protein